MGYLFNGILRMDKSTHLWKYEETFKKSEKINSLKTVNYKQINEYASV